MVDKYWAQHGAPFHGCLRAAVANSLKLILFSCVTSLSLMAATLPPGFSETQIASGLTSPTAMEIAPDGRIFVCLQGGRLRVIKNGSLLATPFLTLTVDSNGERGLLGIAFDPNFTTNQFVYVYYTVPGDPAHNRVSRFTANGDVAAAGSELVLVDLDNLSGAGNHNGGAIHFGPDGKLYIAVGENANAANSQTLSNRLGKMLRINANGSIPNDNPFFSTATGANRSIWAMGLRNPFTFAFQPVTGRMFINDVGETLWEEINEGVAGSNYGWNLCEGVCSPPRSNFRDPLFQYAHGTTSTQGCAIVGGGFYNPNTAQFPASYFGKYFFGDLCNGWIRLFDPTNNTASDFATGISSPVDIKVASDGSLYYLAIGSAAVFRVQFTGTAPPPALVTEASSDSAVALDSVTLFRDPFPITNTLNFSSDNRTRVIFFATNLAFSPGDAITARAEDAQLNLYLLPVEYVGAMPGLSAFTEVVVALPSNLPVGQSVLVSLTWHAQTTNKARIRIK
ncbi:MAG TPA: PQQ-dependent sugar dehydrogenase [Pyrinomonadaceae bacterium]|nr:PQQ-dependent sugar dehydrogenase [Pyrinomonadaceae bacterium]